jgi:hypothetical protein
MEESRFVLQCAVTIRAFPQIASNCKHEHLPSPIFLQKLSAHPQILARKMEGN